MCIDEEILEKVQDLLTKLEAADFADEDGELYDPGECEDTYEELSSKEQKKVEKVIRQGVAAIKKAAEKVLEEIKTIDDRVLDDEDGEDEDPDDD